MYRKHPEYILYTFENKFRANVPYIVQYVLHNATHYTRVARRFVATVKTRPFYDDIHTI